MRVAAASKNLSYNARRIVMLMRSAREAIDRSSGWPAFEYLHGVNTRAPAALGEKFGGNGIERRAREASRAVANRWR